MGFLERKVRIGLVQMSVSHNAKENLSKAVKAIEKAAAKGANIVCLPEVFTAPYFPQWKEFDATPYLETIPGNTTEILSRLAKKLGIVIVCGSIFEKSSQGNYNTSVVIDADGKLLGKYRKTHIPHDPSFYEQYYFKPGNSGFKVFKTKYGKIAPLICFDQWFPEAARCAALAGAEIIFYPTAIATVEGIEQAEGSWLKAWEAVQRGHAIANSVVVATVNRCGKEGNMNFWGGSFVYDQFGVLKANAGRKEKVLVAEVDLAKQAFLRESWRFFKERRPKEYAQLLKGKTR